MCGVCHLELELRTGDHYWFNCLLLYVDSIGSQVFEALGTRLATLDDKGYRNYYGELGVCVSVCAQLTVKCMYGYCDDKYAQLEIVD